MFDSIGKKIFAGVTGTVMMLSALPISQAIISASADDEDNTTAIYETDFEDGDISQFSKRGDTDSSTLSLGTDGGNSGDNYLLVSGRQKSWNGPQLALDDRCTAGSQYTVSAAVKTPWYATVTLSMQYTTSSGDTKYTNLTSVVSQGDWVTMDAYKFSMPSDVTGVYVYFECSDTNVNILVDDFSLRTAQTYSIEEDIVSLKDAYADCFKTGVAVTTDELAATTTQDLILKHFNSITLGNELKPDALLNQSATQAAGTPQIDISGARSILNFARDNNIPVRGHVLVWHSQTPDWFFKEDYSDDGDWVDEDTMLERMEAYIKIVFETVTSEYPTVDFYAWDVVNECYLDDGSARNPGEQGSSGSNNSAWVQVFGDNSFIKYAFQYARKYAPEGCKLYYNDFNEYSPQKTTAIVEMVTELKEEGLIDGIGCQSHLDVSYPSISVYKKAIAAFAETGLDIQITELDVTTSDTSEAGFETQAQYYSDIMDVLVEYKDYISSVTFWGTTDDKSWRSAKCPLLFNEDYTAKPAFYSIVDGLEVSTTESTEAIETTTEEVTEATTEEITETTTEKVTETTASGETTEYICGDFNMDKKISVADVVKFSKYILKLETFTKEEYELGDLNGDGKVNVIDLSLLKNPDLMGFDYSDTSVSDANGDGVVDYLDVEFIIQNSGIAYA